MATAAETADTGSQLQEVVVTAEKREEKLLDVPIPVTALDPSALAQNGLDRLQDYFSSVPGLTLTNSGDGLQTIVVRGLSTGVGANPTVGVAIDDVPYGSSTAQGIGGSTYPDLDPGDLARVEVLRGPQGTLYGASSIGGLLKFVTQDPSPTGGVTGRTEVTANWLDAGGFGYTVRGSANIPVTDTIAIRASAFGRHDPGYIDNLQTAQPDVNTQRAYGGRVAALWHISENFSVKLSALVQKFSGDGVTQVDTNSSLQPLYGDLTQSRLRGTGHNSLEVQQYTATIKARFADMDFVSLTGWGETHSITNNDQTPGLGFLSEIVYNVPGSALYNTYPTDKFSQEFRLSSTLGRNLDWLLGLFYTHEAASAIQYLNAIDPTTGAITGLVGEFNFPSTFAERAVFADLTYHFTDRFNVQIGARASHINQVYNETDSGPYIPLAFPGQPSPLTYATIHTEGSPITYLFTPQYVISPDLMSYIRVASGYRSGGPNAAAGLFQLPASFQPDKSWNYELGLKGTFWDKRLTMDVSGYYIQWQRLQLQVIDPTTQYAYFINAGDAKSEGVELALQAVPTRGLKLGLNAAYNHAVLTDPIPAGGSAVGAPGDRLPYSARFTGSLTAEQDFPLSDTTEGFLGGTVSYIGDRYSEFAATEAGRVLLPSYTQLDLRSGMHYANWTLTLYANNVTNKRGVLAESPFAPGTIGVTYIQPLTVGLSAILNF